MSRIKALAGTAVIAAALLAIPAPALAKGTDVIRTGSCSGAADWKLKVGREDAGLDVEFEVDANRVGQVWRVRIWDNGVLRYGNLKTTKAPSGSFTVHRTIRNMAGTDTIVARARNVNSGQLCVARITY
jgi:hypothetical protein